jgi:hypothetical protein
MSEKRVECAPLRRFAALVAVVLGTSVMPVGAQSWLPVEGRVVAADGSPVAAIPGLAFGGSGAFDLPVIDEAGRAGFRGRLIGPGVTSFNERALFVGASAGELQIVARGGDAAPGLPGLALQSAAASGPGGSLRLSPDGDAFFGSFIAGPGVTAADDTALFASSGGSLALLVREGEAAPGTAGASFAASFSSPFPSATAFNRNGRAVFQSVLAGGDTTPLNDTAWFGGSQFGIQLVQREGDVTANGLTIGTLGSVCQLNDLDQFLYSAALQQVGGVTVADDETLWIHTPGLASVLVLREGSPAPGTAGASFGNATNTWIEGIGANAFNRYASFVFVSDLVGGDAIAGVNDRGVFIGSPAGITLVSRKGDPAPGGAASFGTASAGSLSINGNGDVLFQATITGGGATSADDTGVWTGPAGGLALVAREGSVAPGAGGALFGSFSGSQMHFNDRGQVLLTASLTGPGVTGPANNAALYAYDPVAGLSLVLRGSDAITLVPGLVKTVSTFATVQFGNGDGAALAFNHAGDFVLRATMTDATAAILTGHVGTLSADVHALSAGAGGTQVLRLRGGPARAGLTYFVGGTASGTSPGFSVGGFHAPLNVDEYFFIAIQFCNSPYLANTLGVLDQEGRATASINVPPGLPLAGLVLHHAFGAYDAMNVPSMISEPVRLEFVP